MSSVQSTNGTLSSSLLASLNGTSGTSSTSSTGGTSSSSGAASTSSTQANFLNLLVTQLQNQDPLNPMDNAQVTSQLAQISTVDGITQLNTTLQTLLSNSTDSQTLQAASLVGQNVLVSGNGINLTQGQGSLAGVELAGAADSVTATIKDSNGLVVKTLHLGSMSAGDNTFVWDGTADNGTAAAAGAYSLSVAATQGNSSVTATALQTGQVSSVARGTSGVSINVGNLGTFAPSAIKQIL